MIEQRGGLLGLVALVLDVGRVTFFINSASWSMNSGSQGESASQSEEPFTGKIVRERDRIRDQPVATGHRYSLSFVCIGSLPSWSTL